MLRGAIFVAVSSGILALSWRSLRDRRSHGFYRFFAFELLLALVLWNAAYWFREPFSARQIASWMLLAVSLGLAIEGFRLLHRVGKPSRQAERDANLRFENTTTLVTVGPYRLIRHPLYASLLALAWGAFLKHPSLGSTGLAAGASVFLAATAMIEERENLERFGTAYAAYRRATKRFVPFLF